MVIPQLNTPPSSAQSRAGGHLPLGQVLTGGDIVFQGFGFGHLFRDKIFDNIAD